MPIPNQTARYRESGSTARGQAVSWRGVQCNGVVQPLVYNWKHREGVIQGMSDVVTPNFRKLISEGTIINTPMTRVKQSFTGGGTGGTVNWLGCAPGTENSLALIESVTEQRYQAQYSYDEVRDVSGHLTWIPPIVDLVSLQRHAGTKALAGVDDSTVQGLVSLGELGKTLATLRNPIQALTQFTARWRSSRTLKRALSGGPKAVANQYLTYYYGIKPTIKDIEGALQAYLNSGIRKSRRTSRSGASDSKTTTSLVGGNPGSGFAWDTVKVDFSETAVVRAGILYAVDHAGDRVAEYGLRISDIPSALLELTPWSFFAGYFVNLSELVSALSPRFGVDYLAAFNVVRLEQVSQWQVIAGGTNQSNTTRTPGSEYAKRVIETVIRTPTSPYANVGFSMYKSTKLLDWSIQKDLAVVSLAIQQLAGHHRAITNLIRQ